MEPIDRNREDDWFRQNERELLEQARAARAERERQRRGQETEEERKRLRELHWLKCPKCGHDLATEDLSGVEIDRCTFCEGVWVDAGELEELFRKREGERRGIVRKMLGI